MDHRQPAGGIGLGQGKGHEQRGDAVAQLVLLLRAPDAHRHERDDLIGHALATALEAAPQRAGGDREDDVVDRRPGLTARVLERLQVGLHVGDPAVTADVLV